MLVGKGGSDVYVGSYMLRQFMPRYYDDVWQERRLWYTDCPEEDLRVLSRRQQNEWLILGRVDAPEPSMRRLVAYGVASLLLAVPVLGLLWLAVTLFLSSPLVAAILVLLALIPGLLLDKPLSGLFRELKVRNNARKVKYFMERKYIHLDITKVVTKVLVVSLARHLQELSTPLVPMYKRDWEDRVVKKTARYRKFAQDSLTPEDIDQIVSSNLQVVRLLTDSLMSTRLPKLEEQALIKRLQPSIWAVAARIHAGRRQEIGNLRRLRARIDAYAQGEREAFQAQVYGALGWSPEEVEARRFLDDI